MIVLIPIDDLIFKYIFSALNGLSEPLKKKYRREYEIEREKSGFWKKLKWVVSAQNTLLAFIKEHASSSQRIYTYNKYFISISLCSPGWPRISLCRPGWP